jgi:hypothetical protein
MSGDNNKTKTSASKVKKVGKKTSTKKNVEKLSTDQEKLLVEDHNVKEVSGNDNQVEVEKMVLDPLIQSGGAGDQAEGDAVPVEEQTGGNTSSKKPVVKKEKKKKEKKEKAPKKPRAKTAYNFFVSENMKELMKMDEWKDKKNSELMKECGSRWKSCTDETKAPYQKLAAEEKSKLEASN